MSVTLYFLLWYGLPSIKVTKTIEFYHNITL